VFSRQTGRKARGFFVSGHGSDPVSWPLGRGIVKS